MNHPVGWAAVVSGNSGLRQKRRARDICWNILYIALHSPGYPEFSVFCGVFSLLIDIPKCFLHSSVGKESACNAGDANLIPGSGRSSWRRVRLPTPVFLGFPCGSAGKESNCNVGNLGSVPGLGKSPGEGKGYPLQYSGLENSMDCIAHGDTKSRTWLSDFHFSDIPRKQHTDPPNDVCFWFCGLCVFPGWMFLLDASELLIFSYNLQGIHHLLKHIPEQLLSKYLFTENKVFSEIKE